MDGKRLIQKWNMLQKISKIETLNKMNKWVEILIGPHLFVV